MALLVDGDVNRIGNLKEHDTSVLEVANGEGIDLQSKLRVAQTEIEEEVEEFLRWEGRGRLEQVYIDTTLQRWHALKSLEAVYRDAYFSQLNDRYGERWKTYREMAAVQGKRYLNKGVALVSAALRRPEKVEARIVEGAAPAASYWVQATFVDGGGRESAASELYVTSSPVPHGLEVSVPYWSAGATHWNVYAGWTEDEVSLQNPLPLAVGTKWSLFDGGLVSRRPAGTGQPPDQLVERTRLRRS